MTQGIQIRDLQSTSSLSNSASILALTDNLNNTVNLISKANLITSLISSNANNLLTSDSNGLLVNNIIGVLSNLDTTDKTSIVNAINELFNDKAFVAQPVTTLATSGTITLSDNSINTITPTGNITFSLPSISGASNKFHQILVQVNLTTVYGINPGTTYYFNGTAPTFSAIGNYDIIYEFDAAKNKWAVGSIYKSEVA